MSYQVGRDNLYHIPISADLTRPINRKTKSFDLAKKQSREQYVSKRF